MCISKKAFVIFHTRTSLDRIHIAQSANTNAAEMLFET